MSKPSYALVWYYMLQFETYVCFMLREEHTEDEPLVITNEKRKTDEGWASELTVIWMDNDGVHLAEQTDGVDCDGRVSADQEFVAKYDAFDPCNIETHKVCVSEEEEEQPRFLPFKVPHWKELESSQRDYAAEAMGY